VLAAERIQGHKGLVRFDALLNFEFRISN